MVLALFSPLEWNYVELTAIHNSRGFCMMLALYFPLEWNYVKLTAIHLNC
jgi:hypothetical protein